MTSNKFKRKMKNKIFELCKPRNVLKDQSGMTMVEVLIGFVVLSIMIASLSGIISVATNMLQRSADLKHKDEAILATVYKKEPVALATPTATSFKLKNVKDGTEVTVATNFFAINSNDFLSSDVQDGIDVKVYYFKAN